MVIPFLKIGGDKVTGENIIALAEQLLDDNIPTEPEGTELELINEAIRDMSNKAPMLDIITLSFTGSDAYVDRPATLQTILSLKNGLTDLQFKSPISISDFTTESPDPLYYYYKGSKIGINPVPEDDIDLTAVAEVGYTELTDLTGAPSDLPALFHDAISYYIAWKRADEFGTSQISQNKFNMLKEGYYDRVGQLAINNSSDYGEYATTKDVLPSRGGR